MSRSDDAVVSIGRKARGRAECVPRPAKRRALGDVLPVVKALADENRLAILELLLGVDGELCACEIEAAFDVTQSTISHHMKVLRDAGLVDADKRGLWVYYRPTARCRAAADALAVAAKGR